MCECVFVRLPTHVWRVWVDPLHALDLGIYQIIAASVLIELVNEGMWAAATISERFLLAHKDHKRWCSARGLDPPPRFDHERFKVKKKNPFPSFTQFMAKGAQTRQLILWLTECCLRPGLENLNDHAKLRLAMMMNISIYENIYNANWRVIPPADLERARVATEKALVCLNALSDAAIHSGNRLYHIIPKGHMVTHMSYDMAHQANPRSVTCYADEDMVGRMKRIVVKCHGASAAKMALMRYLILVGLGLWSTLASLRGLT